MRWKPFGKRTSGGRAAIAGFDPFHIRPSAMHPFASWQSWLLGSLATLEDRLILISVLRQAGPCKTEAYHEREGFRAVIRRGRATTR